MKSMITNLDMYSSEVYFTINSGNKRIQTIYGGLITITATIAMITLSVLFLIQFFQGSSSSVLSKDESTEDLNITLNNYPFMLRLSTEKVHVYNDTARLYSITLKLKVGGGNYTSQWTDDIAMEPCDINKHFGEYAYLFKEIEDIDTFFCPVGRMANQSVVGIYGGEKVFQYYHFYITMCVNSTESSNCYDEATMTKYLKATYLDVRTVDYNLDSNGAHDKPYSLFVRSDRHSISNTVYKRIWMYMESIDYYKDIGLVFESQELYSFFKMNSFRYDMDVRDIFHGVTIPGTFANLSVLNYSNKRTYFQKYMKAQEFFANMGGITKIISVIALILNYGFSEAAYKTKIMSYLFEEIKEVKKRKSVATVNSNFNGTIGATKTSFATIQNTKTPKEPDFTPKNKNKISSTNQKLPFVPPTDTKIIKRKNIKIPKLEAVFAKLFCTKKVSRVYLNNYGYINTELDVNSYIKLKKQFKEMILSYKVSGKFPHLYQEKPYLLNSNNNLVDINNPNPSSSNCTYESSSIRLYNSNYALSPQKNSNFAPKFNILPKS